METKYNKTLESYEYEYKMDHCSPGYYCWYNQITESNVKEAAEKLEKSVTEHLGLIRVDENETVKLFDNTRENNYDYVLCLYLSEVGGALKELRELKRFHHDQAKGLRGKPKIIFFIYQEIKKKVVPEGIIAANSGNGEPPEYIAMEADIFVVKIVADDIAKTLKIISENIEKIEEKILFSDFIIKLGHYFDNMTSIDSGRKRLYLEPKKNFS